MATLCFGLSATGCDQISARRKIQDANKEYNMGRYAKATELYDKALTESPDISIGHHNAGLAYAKMFEPGTEGPKNQEYAEKAASHLQTYLKDSPNDARIIGILTQIWVDSKQFDKALAYWEAEHQKDPKDKAILTNLSGINRQAQKYDDAISWLQKKLDLENNDDGRVTVLMEMGALYRSRLSNQSLFDDERLAVADMALGYLQKAEALNGKNPQLQGALASTYQWRAFAHGASWARLPDLASQSMHLRKFSEIQKSATAKAPAPAAPAAEAPQK